MKSVPYFHCMLLAASIVVVVVLSSASADDSLSFLVVGDWGGKNIYPYTTYGQKQVAEQMGKIGDKYNSKFTLGLGDNFYTEGVTDVSDPRFNTTFDEVFTAPVLQSRWYMVLGNHDHNGNVTAQIEYTQHSSRWYLPAQWYSEVLSFGNNVTVQFVFIDTVVLPSSEEELTWIEETLASSTADWLFVAGHFPVYSLGEHGPTQYLIDNLKPLMMKYNAVAYLCGHDHSLQHINDGSTVEYLVSGSGHLCTTSTQHLDELPPNSLKFNWPDHVTSDPHGGFMVIELHDETSMTSTFYDDEGTLLYSFGKTNPRTAVFDTQPVLN